MCKYAEDWSKDENLLGKLVVVHHHTLILKLQQIRAVGTGPAGPVLAGPLFGCGLVPRRTDVWERDYFGREVSVHVREHEGQHVLYYSALVTA